MTKLNPQAEELNQILTHQNPFLFDILSQKGKEIYFPKKGIPAQSKDAQDKKINATIGMAMEDDGSPMRLSSIKNKINLEPKQIFPYASSYGQEELRKIWASKIRKDNPSLTTTTTTQTTTPKTTPTTPTNISLPIVTCGITHALSVAGYLFVNPGDEILVPNLYWGNYRLIFENSYGAILKTYNTFNHNNNGLDLDSFEQTLTQSSNNLSSNPLTKQTNKKIILLNFPHNPSGYSPTTEESLKIISLIKHQANKGDKIIVLCDDAYFGLFFEKNIFPESLFSLLSTAHENILAIKIDGATKEEFSWGLRVGFITFGTKINSPHIYTALENKTAGAIRGMISNNSQLSQSLILEGLTSPNHEQEKEQKQNLLQERYDEVKIILAEKKYSSFFTPLPFNSGYFLSLQLKTSLDSEKIRQLLLTKYDTGVIAFPGLLRISFASVPKQYLSLLFENIYHACQVEQQNSSNPHPQLI